jgi:hypothetical protein
VAVKSRGRWAGSDVRFLEIGEEEEEEGRRKRKMSGEEHRGERRRNVLHDRVSFLNTTSSSLCGHSRWQV